MLEILNVLFHCLHLIVIIFNTIFWMFSRTLRIAQVTQVLTLVSWFGFGFFYGFGYCFLTDWHWQIKEKLGERNLPASYIKFVLDNITGQDLNAQWIDRGTFAVLLISLVGCAVNSRRQKV